MDTTKSLFALLLSAAVAAHSEPGNSPFEKGLVLRQGELMSESTWEDMDALAVSEPEESVWDSFGKLAPADLPPCLTDQQLLFEHPKARLFRRMGTDGTKTVLAYVWMTDLIQRPLAVEVDGLRQHDSGPMDSGTDSLVEFVQEHIIPISDGKYFSICSAEGLLTPDDRVVGTVSGRKWIPPFAKTYFLLVDDNPKGGLSQSFRYFFVSEDFSSFAAVSASESAFVLRGNSELELRVLLEQLPMAERDAPTIEETRTNVSSAFGSGNSLIVEGDSTHSYALLISGGVNRSRNHTRYWGDISAVYSTLTKTYGYSKGNIKVLMSDGTSSNPDLSYGTSTSQSHSSFGNNSPLDLDGDGYSDVYGSATKDNIRSAIESYKSSLGSDDQLFIFITDHGTQDVDTGKKYLIPWLGQNTAFTSYSQAISSTDFAEMASNFQCPVAYAFEFCFSGSFYDALALKSSPGGRCVATAAHLTESSSFTRTSKATGATSSQAFNYIDPWVYYYVAALRGAYPQLSTTPWKNSSSCDADISGNGKVSFREAAIFADSQIENDGYPEDPQYDGGGSDFYPLRILAESRPDLGFYKPSGWKAPVIVTDAEGSTTPVSVFSPGQTVYVDYSWSNYGKTTPGSYRIFVSLKNASGEQVDYWYVNYSASPSPGYYKSRTSDNNFETTLGPGNYTVTVYLDSHRTVEETDESNNEHSVSFQVVSGSVSSPDLRFAIPQGWSDNAFLHSAEGKSPQTSFPSNSSVYLDFCYMCQGAPIGSHSVWVALYGENEYLSRWSYSTSFPSLADGQGKSFQNIELPSNLPLGSYRVFLWIDSGNDIAESNEDNNTQTIYFTVTTSGPASVHRFYSKNYKGHFFTISEAEKEDLRTHNPNWKYEGAAYKAYMANVSGTTALYRFYSKGYRGHFFTIDADEAETVKKNPNWKYEGIAYYVYRNATSGSVPVFRFWSKGYRHHFYTTDEAEMQNLIATNPNWKYEGIAFYALPADYTGNSAYGAGRAAAAAVAAAAAGAGVEGEGTGETGGTGGAAAPWALMLRRPCPGRILTVPDVADLGDILIEVGDETSACLAILAAAATADAGGAADAELRLTLPDGVFTAQLWDGAGTLLEESEAEGYFDFSLAANGVWRWLVIIDADGEKVFSIWLRAE